MKGDDSCLEAGKSAETATTAAPSTEPAATSIDSAEGVKDTGVDAVAGVYKVPHTPPPREAREVNIMDVGKNITRRKGKGEAILSSL